NQWNSTDITVNTYSRGSILVSNLPVYRNVTTSTVYTVDLMSPVYGISTQFQSPQSISASTSDNTGKITASYDVRYGYVPMISTSTQPLGAIEYRSNNLYYTPQTYYYQLGGVFLEQPDGSTNEIPPAISISMMGSSPVVNVGEILILGGVTSTQVSGSGPISITSAVTDLSSAPLPAGNNTRWVNLSIQAASTNASEMWNRTFQDLANRGGLPVTSYTTGRSGNVAFLYITGNSQTYDVRLSLTRVNVSADYVEEYSTGGISRSWRNVPGFEAPTNTTTGTTTAPTTTTSTVTPTPTPTPIGGGPFWLNSTTVSGGYKLITTKPLGSSASGTSNTKFYSDAFSGGEVLNAGTTNVYLWMQTSPASPFNITWDYGSGGTWTTLGRYKGAFAAAGSPWLFTIPFGTDGHTFAAGEQLRLNLTYDFGSSPNGVYWDGVYNDSRVETPSSPCVPTFVQAASNSSYGPNVVITLPGPSTWGDLIIVSFDVQRNGGSPGILTKVDTKGNTYSSAASTDWNGTFYRAWTDYATNIIGGGPITINITLSTNTGSSYTHAAEYSCVASVTPLDQIRSNTGTGGLTLYSGPRTTTQASELIFGYGVSEGTCSVDAPYTARDTAFGSFIADQTVSSIGSYNVTGSMSYAQQWGCQMVTFIGR
ncbi:MAG: hypothetical protein LUQ67_08710, partial [Methanomicrobiales archaeon]|nr:hypothetical protein [Methanomicrobiales archaeon]